MDLSDQKSHPINPVLHWSFKSFLAPEYRTGNSLLTGSFLIFCGLHTLHTFLKQNCDKAMPLLQNSDFSSLSQGQSSYSLARSLQWLLSCLTHHSPLVQIIASPLYEKCYHSLTCHMPSLLGMLFTLLGLQDPTLNFLPLQSLPPLKYTRSPLCPQSAWYIL